MKEQLPGESERVGRMTKRNSSGMVGVWPRITSFQSDSVDIDYCRWYARWPGCPLKGGVSFSAEIFGDNDAFTLAYLAREHQTIDRAWLVKKLQQFRKTAKYQSVLAQKQLTFVRSSDN